MKIVTCIHDLRTWRLMFALWNLILSLITVCQCDIVINELWVNSDSNSTRVYVELYNNGNSSFSISNFSLAIFNSSSASSVKKVQDVVLPAEGYYTVGSSELVQDVDLEWSDVAFLDSAVGGVGLYDVEIGTVAIGMQATATYLQDALVFSTVAVSTAPGLLENLNVPKVIIQDELYLPNQNLSINRCLNGNEVVYWFASVTAKQENDCKNRVISSPIIINELNALNQGEDTTEYIELYNKANISVSLDEYTLVLYSGVTDRMYNVLALTNYTIDPLGYFVIGSSNVFPRPQKVVGNARDVNILQNGVAAVALYCGNNTQLSQGRNVTNVSLVDAVVYDKRGRYDQELIDVLTPGQVTIHEDSRHILQDESMSRCSGNNRLNASQFSLSPITPNTENDCSLASMPPHMVIPSFPPINSEGLPYIVINEFKVVRSQPFIELFNGGLGNMALDNILLVMYSGNSLAVAGNPVILDGHHTDENGLFLIGTADMEPTPDYVIPNLPQLNGCNAIAVHLAESSRSLVAGSPVSKESLLDVVLFGEVTDPQDQDLIDILAPGQEPLPLGNTNQSWSRCKGWDRFMQNSFSTSDVSPKAINICLPPPIVINEINAFANGTNHFIEIYDGGRGSQALDGLVLALYNGVGNRAFKVLDLTGYSTDEAGFLVIGPSNGTNVDYVADSTDGTFLETGPDAVAIHVGPAKFYRSRQASDLNLVDAVVYRTDDKPDLDLLHLLMPNQHHLNELPSTTPNSSDLSISRCYCCLQRNHSSFGLAPVSPGSINVDCYQDNRTFTETVRMYHRQLRISEIKMDSDSSTGGGFIEIYDGGLGGVDLSNILVDWYTMNSNGQSYYLRFNLDTYQTDAGGYFVIRSPSPDVLPIIIANQTTSSTMEEQSFDHQSPLMLQSDAVNIQLVSATLDKVLDTITFGTNGTDDLNVFGSLDVSQPLIIINDQVLTGLSSVQRCYSPKPKEQLAFAIYSPTPGIVNSCPIVPIVISEINTDSPIIALGEYVELSSLGVPNFPVNNITLVAINGASGTVYRSLELNGYRTDTNGLLLIGYRSLSLPRPDVPRFRQPVGWVPDGPDAIAIYKGKRYMYMEGTTPDEQYLIQRVDYGYENGTEDMDMSISRCRHSNGSIVYQQANVSPKAVNKCPAREDMVLVINEVSLAGGQQFIEIWDLGNGFTVLDDFMVVLYGENDVSYLNIPLTGYQTNQAGYIVMGEGSVSPSPHNLLNSGFLRANYGAIALYRIQNNMSYSVGSQPGTEGLLDAIVYSDWINGSSTGLSQYLTPNSVSIPSDMLQVSSSLSRCFSLDRLTMSPFLMADFSPDGLNLCPSFITDIIINEINVDLPGMDGLEFIELYDGGRGNVSLDYTTLALYNGANNAGRSYLALGLDGYHTNSDGFFVIGSHLMGQSADLLVHTAKRGFLQNGPDAIALYRAHVGAFPFGTSVTEAGLIDAVVYSTNNKEGRRLVDFLVPGYFTVKEDRTHLQNDESLSRCHGLQKRDPTVYGLTIPTMGRTNNCSASVDFDSTIIINEIYVADDSADNIGKYIEIYDHGVGHTLLNGFLMVFFDGSDQDRSYYEIDLSNRFTNVEGFLLVGTAYTVPLPDIIIPEGIIQVGSDAIVLYRATPESFPRGSNLSLDNIQDAVVYGSSLVADNSLMTSLAPGQLQVMVERGSAASRCLANRPISMSAFISTMATPDQNNNCTTPVVVISELSLDGQDGSTQEFIELYDGGRGSTPLDSMVLVLFTGVNGGRAYKTIPLQGQRTDVNGYFLIATAQISSNGDMLVGDIGQSFLRNGANAMALYKGDYHDYKAGMPATSIGLLDAVVYGDMNHQSMTLLRQLLPGQAQVTVNSSYYQGTESISRCMCCQPLLSSAYKLVQPSPRQPNHCSGYPPVTPSPVLVVLNEINPYDETTGGKEFIELKGPANAALDQYAVVMVIENGDSLRVSYVVDLTGQRLDQHGFLVIGASSMAPLPRITLPSVVNGTLKAVGGAVTLCKGQPQDFRVGSSVPMTRVVDALVYRGQNGSVSKALSILALDGKILEDDASYLPGDETFSRCSCCELRTDGAFMLTSSTPGYDNACPKPQYGQTIHLRLKDADFEEWQSKAKWKAALRDAVVEGVRGECKCRFNSNYLKDETFLNGSVIYQANLAAVSTGQASELIDAYTRFVKKTESLEIFGVAYSIDRDCIMDCKAKRNNLAILQHPAPAVIVGVTLTVIITLVFAIAVFTYIKRKKGSNFTTRSFRWFKEENDLDDEFRVTDACQLDDLDVLSQAVSSDNFVNPVRTLPSMLQASLSARRWDQDPGNGPISVDLEVDTSISYA